MNPNTLILASLLFLLLFIEVKCLQKRCIRCRSRGELGTCKDPFPFNATDPESVHGIHVAACPSGWCGKLTQANSPGFKSEDYGAATQRLCLQRAPSDYEERCAYTTWNHKSVYMCFCNGDLCNSAFTFQILPPMTVLSILVTIYNML